MKIFIALYRFIFCRAFFYTLNLRIFDLCLRGIGILNYEGYRVSGEQWFLESYLQKRATKTIVDVGANTDPYGIELPSVNVYALEPNRSTFKELQKNVQHSPHIQCFPMGLSNKKGTATLYDISSRGTALASLEKDAVERMYKVKAKKSTIKLTTLDAFVKEQKITSIDLLKIDTEGNEYNVLLGAKETLKAKKISCILFEFNETNVYSRVFLKDFYELLEGFSFYRLMPDGMSPLGEYKAITHELFAFQNIIAIRGK